MSLSCTSGKTFYGTKEEGRSWQRIQGDGPSREVGHLQRNFVAPLWQLKNDILGAGGGINVPMKIETVLGKRQAREIRRALELEGIYATIQECN